MKYPLVSLCMSSYNNAQYAVATLESLRIQTYPNTEIIIVDDYSTDDSVKVIENWLMGCKIPHRFIRHEKNMGVCRVANDLISNAEGKYISIIASDDLMLPHKISSQVKLLEAAPAEVGIVHSDLTKIDPEGDVLVPSVYAAGQIKPFSGDVWLEMLKTNFLGGMTMLTRRDCFIEAGPFDENLNYEDWDMWLRLARVCQFMYQPEITVLYRIHGNSFMHRRYRQIVESNMRILSKQMGVSDEGDAIIRKHFIQFSEELYRLGSSESVRWLKERQRLFPDKRGLALLWLARLGIPANTMVNAKSWLKKMTGRPIEPVA